MGPNSASITREMKKPRLGSTEVEILNDGQIAVFKERGLKYLLHVGGQNFEILGELFGFFQNHLKTHSPIQEEKRPEEV